MRAEDLFEAMGALDEQLIALSEEDARRAREAGRQSAREKENRKIAKRRKRAEIYRFAAVAMTTAAAVFIVLTARDFLGARNSGLSENAAVSSEYSREESAAEEAAQDTLAAGALGIEADEAAEQLDLFDLVSDPAPPGHAKRDRERQDRMEAAVDTLRQKMGPLAVTLGIQRNEEIGIRREWKKKKPDD